MNGSNAWVWISNRVQYASSTPKVVTPANRIIGHSRLLGTIAEDYFAVANA